MSIINNTGFVTNQQRERVGKLLWTTNIRS